LKTIQKIVILFFTLAPLSAFSQGQDLIISGDFNHMPFPEFVKTIENTTNARFYYLDGWVGDITITGSGNQLSLRKLLTSALLPKGYFFNIDQDLRIILTSGLPLVTELPDYTGTHTSLAGNTIQNQGEKITEAELQYIEGKKTGLRETLVVGNGNGNSSYAGTYINGKIVDSETGEPLIGATVYILELKKGTVTDIDGRYNLALPAGKYSIDFSSMGMESQHYTLDIRSAGKLDISMEKSLIPISEVVVTTNRHHNVRGTQMGFEQLNYQVVKDIPVVMGEKDLLKIAQMLPGVQSVGEGSAGINVRGSSADQNMIYINKVPVYNSSHLFGFFSSINPDIIKDFSLYKSNLPVKYGGRLASFFDISTRQGNMKKFSARGGISPITGHVSAEGPVIKDKAAFVVSARSTYSDWILKRLTDPDLRKSEAAFYDLAGVFTYEPNENNLIKVFAYNSNDKFSLGSTNKYIYSNSGTSINLRHRINSRSSADLALVFGTYSFGTTDKSEETFAYRHDYRIDHYELKSDFSWLSANNHKVSYGFSSILYNLNRGNVTPFGELSLRTPVKLGIENGLESAVYVADELVLAERLTVYGGLRISSYLVLGPSEVFRYKSGSPKQQMNIADTLNFNPGSVSKTYFGLEPRLALNYLIDNDRSVKFSYNRVKQYLFMLSNTISISPTDQWKLCDYNILPPYLDQVSAGYYQDYPLRYLSSSIEIYRKWGHNVPEYRDGASFINSPHSEMETLQGKQNTYGIELMLKKNAGRLNGWASYSYSRSFMKFSSPLPGESINYGQPFPSNYDRPHNLSVVCNFKTNRRLSISANMVYITGRPVTYPVAIFYLDNIKYVYYSDRNKYRIPSYYRFDLSLNLEGNLLKKKLAHSFWQLNFYNLTGRNNAYSVFFKNEEGKINGYKLSIFGQPIVTLSWNFKFGNYLSE
jgi:hypothetical protein